MKIFKEKIGTISESSIELENILKNKCTFLMNI